MILTSQLVGSDLRISPFFFPYSTKLVISLVQLLANGGLIWFRDTLYARTLAHAFRHRYAVLLLFITAGAFGLGLIGTGKIRTVFFPDVPGQIITVSLEMDLRAPFRLTKPHVEYIQTIIDRTVVAPEEVAQAVFEQLVPVLQAKYPSVTLEKAGELEEMGEIRGGMVRALLLATVLIYILMAVPLKSYWQPFVILAIVPFGFISAAIGHMIMGIPLSLLSFFGMLALTGVVINDSLVMMTRYNQAREGDLDVNDALESAGVGRFQAIFLTTVTTVFGLLPLLTETSEQAQYLIPAAVSLAFGELFSTVLMLWLWRRSLGL